MKKGTERATERRPVDWAEIRRRVEAAGHALAPESRLSPDRARTLLEERARALARTAEPLAAPGERLEVVTFSLANELYAIECRFIVEAFPLRNLSPLPGAEPPVIGVTSWRGELLTILDLRVVLGIPVTALNDLTRVLVLGAERPAFGILADQVAGTAILTASEVRPLPEAAAARREYLRGITSDAVLVLEAARLLGLADPAVR
jgi:purine-binding chemotaxis protein CheW